ncbi:uncharacterized protein LOC113146874 [Cyclospora cayetanensis]|uniref:Uncharacterized protein LOC113146874 n=1 Tax=Cyclospora cayetanensis TaxID=88456 RepID=A0A6P6RUX9_9EIME|nr:uncharacterized protein LOC113146874 [Cyclospora cayetanensis]
MGRCRGSAAAAAAAAGAAANAAASNRIGSRGSGTSSLSLCCSSARTASGVVAVAAPLTETAVGRTTPPAAATKGCTAPPHSPATEPFCEARPHSSQYCSSSNSGPASSSTVQQEVQSCLHTGVAAIFDIDVLRPSGSAHNS